jgi:hypothetical protein
VRHYRVAAISQPEKPVLVVPAENQRGPQPFEKVKPAVNVRLDRLGFVIRALRASAKCRRVAKVAEVDNGFRLVILAELQHGLDGSRVGVDSVRATNGEQPFPLAGYAWSFHKVSPVARLSQFSFTARKSLENAKSRAGEFSETGCGAGMFCVGPVLQPHKKMHAMPTNTRNTIAVMIMSSTSSSVNLRGFFIAQK